MKYIKIITDEPNGEGWLVDIEDDKGKSIKCGWKEEDGYSFTEIGIKKKKGIKTHRPLKEGSHCWRILEFLKMKPATTADLNFLLRISSYRARISELRARGHDIRAEKIKDNFYKYTLLEEG